MLLRIPKVIYTIVFLLCSMAAYGQAPKPKTSSEIYLALEKLNVLGSALYIAAHPDDENTRLITWLANEKLVNTGYFSFTRGDGGQNLIGPEIGKNLGVIRTQELLQARKIDGGKQFFSRAIDFGYSKSPEETFNIWNKEKVLADLVWVIRNFKPDVMITRFSSTRGGTHGHHTASAILAEEAFEAAGDSTKFPDQLKYVSVWQPKRLYWNTSWWFYGNENNFDTSGLVKIDVGGYNPLLGNSYTEIAAKSRSMHKSQGFGASLERGSSAEYLKPILPANTPNSLFDGVNLSWSKIDGAKDIEKLVLAAIEKFDPRKPSLLVPDLLRIREEIAGLPKHHWKAQKLNEIDALIKACLGLYIEAVAKTSHSAPGDSLQIQIEAINRSPISVELVGMESEAIAFGRSPNQELKNNEPLFIEETVKMPADMAYTQPYWLREEKQPGLFTVSNQKLIGLAEDSAAVQFQIAVEVMGETLSFDIPLVYKSTDPVKGEQYQPFEITPPVFINFEETVLIFPDEISKKISVLVTAATSDLQGDLKLIVPVGWSVTPKSIPVDMQDEGEEKRLTFSLSPPEAAAENTITVALALNGETYNKSKLAIEYDHIPKQVLVPDAKAKVVKLDIKKRGELVGYIMGAGDNIPASLAQIGYKVDILGDGMITPSNLKKYDAIIVGIRAYNTVERLKFYQPVLLEYVKEGGTLIVQYNTNSSLVTDQIGPYPLSISRDRVTVEDADVNILAPGHIALNFPNKITDVDFENWVQERGLYFPDEWSEEYVPLLSSHDPGEDPKKGGLLVAQYGKGFYVYTGYSWFRELPAGVPGAYRLFTNLISIGKSNL